MSIGLDSYGSSGQAEEYLAQLDSSLESESWWRESSIGSTLSFVASLVTGADRHKKEKLYEAMTFVQSYRAEKVRSTSATISVSSCKGKCASCKVSSGIRQTRAKTYEEVRHDLEVIKREVEAERNALGECLDILSRKDLSNEELLGELHLLKFR